MFFLSQKLKDLLFADLQEKKLPVTAADQTVHILQNIKDENMERFVFTFSLLTLNESVVCQTIRQSCVSDNQTIMVNSDSDEFLLYSGNSLLHLVAKSNHTSKYDFLCLNELYMYFKF